MSASQGGPPRFADRREAGRRLGEALGRMQLADPVVLALPRGGVPVGYEVARALRAPLDIILVRKLGAPRQEEYGIGAVVEGETPQRILSAEAMAIARPSAAYVEAETARQLHEMERRRALYAGDRPSVPLTGRTAIVVDDGIATGGTVRAALKALRERKPARIVLAVPLAPPDAIARLRSEADDVVCLEMPAVFNAVGLHYADFTQTSDGEVVALLRGARQNSRS